MQIYADHLAAHLKQGLRSLYTVHGNEPLLVQEAVDAIRATARQSGYTERTSHTVQGSAVISGCTYGIYGGLAGLVTIVILVFSSPLLAGLVGLTSLLGGFNGGTLAEGFRFSRNNKK